MDRMQAAATLAQEREGSEIHPTQLPSAAVAARQKYEDGLGPIREVEYRRNWYLVAQCRALLSQLLLGTGYRFVNVVSLVAT